ncbi:MAG TPA: DUF4404 family protein [Steroidobacteraceae bacterium]|jgi:hypothetical protein
MSDETLRELLAKVHERLRTSGALDADARELLLTVMRDIDATLGERKAASAGADRTRASPVPRLEALAVRFEAGHPGLAQVLRQIAAVLGQGGL